MRLKSQIEASSNLPMEEQIEASSKKVRGRSKRTLALIEAMRKIAEETRRSPGEGLVIGYSLPA